jgi:predicted DNA-binding protein
MLMSKDLFVRVDDELNEKIEAAAKVEGRTVSGFIRYVLGKHLADFNAIAAGNPPKEKRRAEKSKRVADG